MGIPNSAPEPCVSTEHFDVIIVGAGLSGIGAAYRLQERCPNERYAILEARAEIGGTWSLFRYPGVRSDSDMFTLGYPFRPWKEARIIADGPSILQYVRDTAGECGIDRKIRCNHRVRWASWSTHHARWSLLVETGLDGETAEYTCDFLYGCSGYYSYDSGHQPDFPGAARFRGRMVHPQFWPNDLDYTGQRVVVIGSGATAVTLVPAMAERAAHVTMLQRSPSYLVSLPPRDPIANWLRRVLPANTAHRTVRWKNALIALGLYKFCRGMPSTAKRLIRGAAKNALPEGYEVDKHFAPRYQPWEQRLCIVPDSDMFRAISAGHASVVTGQIETFTERGIRLTSGEELETDIVVSATGLKMLALGGIRLTVDGASVDPGCSFIYKGVMLGNVPNFAFCVGYTNASWTLRADLSSLYVCRLLNHMSQRGYRTCVPQCDPSALDPKPLLDLSSGYILRAAAELPKQASQKPWFIRQNYVLDSLTMTLGRIEDGTLQFTRSPNLHQVALQQDVETASSVVQ